MVHDVADCDLRRAIHSALGFGSDRGGRLAPLNRRADCVVEKRIKVTALVVEHVRRADDAVMNFRTDGVTAEGILTHPKFQAAALRVARAELERAIALIERTKWIVDRH